MEQKETVIYVDDGTSDKLGVGCCWLVALVALGTGWLTTTIAHEIVTAAKAVGLSGEVIPTGKLVILVILSVFTGAAAIATSIILCGAIWVWIKEQLDNNNKTFRFNDRHHG